jgi:hypothetical protein
MWAHRREAPLGLLSWGSDPYPYAPDGANRSHGTDLRGTGGGGASLESGLDNVSQRFSVALPVRSTLCLYVVSYRERNASAGPSDGRGAIQPERSLPPVSPFPCIPSKIPHTKYMPYSTGSYRDTVDRDEYDAGYSGMFLMDCKAQIALAQMIGRADAVATLQSRFDTVNKAMLGNLWNASAGYFQNKLSKDLAPVERMAPTHFYPLLAGPEVGPSTEQVQTTIRKHLTNPARFAVWPSGKPPTDHPIPPTEARPLVQWASKECNGKNHTPTYPGCRHTLCCQLICNFDARSGKKERYEGMGLAEPPSPSSQEEQVCNNPHNDINFRLGPRVCFDD